MMPKGSDAKGELAPSGAGAALMTKVVGVMLLGAGVGLSLALLGAMAANGDAAPLVAAIVGPVLVAAMSFAEYRRRGDRGSVQLAQQEALAVYIRVTATGSGAADALAKLSELKAKGDLSEEEFQRHRSSYEKDLRRGRDDS